MPQDMEWKAVFPLERVKLNIHIFFLLETLFSSRLNTVEWLLHFYSEKDNDGAF